MSDLKFAAVMLGVMAAFWGVVWLLLFLLVGATLATQAVIVGLIVNVLTLPGAAVGAL